MYVHAPLINPQCALIKLYLWNVVSGVAMIRIYLELTYKYTTNGTPGSQGRSKLLIGCTVCDSNTISE